MLYFLSKEILYEKKIIITLFILIFGLPSFALLGKPYRYFFNTPYCEYCSCEIQQNLLNHVEVTVDNNNAHYLLLVYNSDVRYLIIPYGNYRQEAYRDFYKNNQAIYEDSNLFRKILYKLNHKKWDKAKHLPRGYTFVGSIQTSI